jgi:hypothetical protein
VVQAGVLLHRLRGWLPRTHHGRPCAHLEGTPCQSHRLPSQTVC